MAAFTVPTSPDVSDTERANANDGTVVEPYLLLTRNEKKTLIAETCESVVVDPEG